MKASLLILSLVASASYSFGGMTQQKETTNKHITLDQESYFTDENGKADPARIINTPIGKLVKIYRPDGFCYTGKVTEIEESDTVFKIYGTVLNVEGAQFGFVLAKGGVFAGAVVESDKDNTYVLEYSDAHKGYALFRSSKYGKPRV